MPPLDPSASLPADPTVEPSENPPAGNTRQKAKTAGKAKAEKEPAKRGPGRPRKKPLVTTGDADGADDGDDEEDDGDVEVDAIADSNTDEGDDDDGLVPRVDPPPEGRYVKFRYDGNTCGGSFKIKDVNLAAKRGRFFSATASRGSSTAPSLKSKFQARS